MVEPLSIIATFCLIGIFYFILRILECCGCKGLLMWFRENIFSKFPRLLTIVLFLFACVLCIVIIREFYDYKNCKECNIHMCTKVMKNNLYECKYIGPLDAKMSWDDKFKKMNSNDHLKKESPSMGTEKKVEEKKDNNLKWDPSFSNMMGPPQDTIWDNVPRDHLSNTKKEVKKKT